ncbi:MAG: tungstate ABC transporter substrate-binding protein WtpA [Victivallales bacterium]|nr:tungstate ABC transporter substrate-binding protein WtpA [Victivallales bacterium]
MKATRLEKFFFLFVFLTVIPFLPGCGKNNDGIGGTGNLEDAVRGKLIIFHAGSLSVPFEKVAAEFEKRHPKIDVLMESAGSRTCARKISELHMRCDVMASADYTVINQFLLPESAKWCVKFAANEMTIVYHAGSVRAGEINSGNWYVILLDDNVAFGRSDPDCDPCGYRAVMTAKLAEIYYGVKGLSKSILKKDSAYIRPKETDLIALLEANVIDYIFLYRSVAVQHKLKYVVLPDEINLKSAKFADFYKQVSVEISGRKPGSRVAKIGAPMIYGVTIPDNAPNRVAALAFLDFLLGPNGGEIMMRNGQPSVVPSYSKTFSKINESLRKYSEREKN